MAASARTMEEALTLALGGERKKQPPAPPASAPPAAAPAAVSPSPTPQAAAAPTACVECGEDVIVSKHAYVAQTCKHVSHASCFARAVLLGRASCAACPAPPMDYEQVLRGGGYTIDAGGDALIRAHAMQVLASPAPQAGTHRGGGVGARLLTRARARADAAAVISEDFDPFHAPAVMPRRTAAVARPGSAVPHEPGGDFAHAVARIPVCIGNTAAAAAAASACTSERCGGARYCLHRVGLAAAARAHGATNDEVTRAVHAWRVHALPVPFGGGVAAAAARQVLLAHAVAGSDAHTLARCGATAEQLALAGVTLADLVRTPSMVPPLADVVNAFALDARRLHVLCFHPAMLVDREHVPLGALLGYSARDLLDFPIRSYDELRNSLGLEPADMAALGFDAPLLAHRFALTASALAAEPPGNAAVWRKQLRLSAALVHKLAPALARAPLPYQLALSAFTDDDDDDDNKAAKQQ